MADGIGTTRKSELAAKGLRPKANAFLIAMAWALIEFIPTHKPLRCAAT